MVNCQKHGDNVAHIKFSINEQTLLTACFRCYVDKIKETGLKDHVKDYEDANMDISDEKEK